MAATHPGLSVVLLGHSHSGKSTFLEAAAFVSRKINEMGVAQKGTLLADYEPEEKEKQMSLQLSIASIEWQKNWIHLIDTPGFVDFAGDVLSGISAADMGLLFMDAVKRVEVGTRQWCRHARERSLPLAIVLTGLDKEGASFEKSMEEISQKLGIQPLALYIPALDGKQLQLTSPLSEKSFICQGRNCKQEAQLDASILGSWREKALEAIAETDDALLEAYLDGKPIEKEKLQSAFYRAVQSRKLVPALSCIPQEATGVPLILEFLKECAIRWKDRSFRLLKGEQEEHFPVDSEGPFYGQVFKTVIDPFAGKVSYLKVWRGKLTAQTPLYNSNQTSSERITSVFRAMGKHLEKTEEVVAGEICALTKLAHTRTGDTLTEQKENHMFPSLPFPTGIYELAVEPEKREDEEKIMEALHRLHEEDPTFTTRRDAELQETIISGMGEVHIETALARAKRKYNVSMRTRLPSIPYRETITHTARAQGRYKRQSGGRGQFGDTYLEIKPLPRGEGFRFIDKIVGGKIPKNYIPAVEKGVKEAMAKGFLAGYPMMDIEVTLYDGSYHPVDSSDMAFQIAGSIGFKKACEQAKPVLLEPIMKIEVFTPQDFVGDIMGDINAKRGKVIGTEITEDFHKIEALAPLSEVQRYAADIKSLTGGQATFHMKFDHYEKLPDHLAQKTIESRKADRDSA